MSDNGDQFLRRAARCAAPLRAMEMLTNLCGPSDDGYEDEPDPEVEEFLEQADELKEKLHVLLSPEMRSEMAALIRNLNANRDTYRKSLLLWFDLVEELAFEVELAYGDHTGPMKLRRVRAAVFYLVGKFTGDLNVPGVPRYLNRLVLHFVISGTVEYIVTLVNGDEIDGQTAAAVGDDNRRLWARDLPRARAELSPPAKMSAFRKAQESAGRLDKSVRVTLVKWWEPFADRFINWLFDKMLAPPSVPADFKRKVDAMVADLTAAAPNVPPVETMTHWFFNVITWAGQHGKEIRAAIDVFSIAINWTAKISDMDRERRIEVVTEALIRYFDELGMNGPFFRFLVRLIVDINLDAIHFLYVKRRVIPPAPAEATPPRP